MSVILFADILENRDLLLAEALYPVYQHPAFKTEEEINLFLGKLNAETRIGYISNQLFELPELHTYFKEQIAGSRTGKEMAFDDLASDSTSIIEYFKEPIENLLRYQRAVYPVDKSQCTELMLIDSAVSYADLFYTAANSTTFPVIYTSSTLRSEIQGLKAKYCLPDCRLAIVADNTCLPWKPFLHHATYFTPEDLTGTTSSENVAFLCREFKTIDFLACETLNNPAWQEYYAILSLKGLTIGASDDQTGNIKYGGDWVMESTGQDIQELYFNESIENYHSTLAVPNMVANETGTWDLSLMTGDVTFTHEGLGQAIVNLTGTWGGTKFIIVNGSNITFDGIGAPPLSMPGLFKSISSGCTGIIIQNISVTSSASITINSTLGGICNGSTVTTTGFNYSVDFINCSISAADINIAYRAGGIAGGDSLNSGTKTFTRCSLTAVNNITLLSITGATFIIGGAGGIAGGDITYSGTKIFIECNVNAGGDITLKSATGGIATSTTLNVSCLTEGASGGIAGGDKTNTGTKTFTRCSLTAGNNITLQSATGGSTAFTANSFTNATTDGGCGGIAGGDQTTSGTKTFTGCSVTAVNSITLQSATGGTVTGGTTTNVVVYATANGGCGGIAGGDKTTTGTLTFVGCSVNAGTNITLLSATGLSTTASSNSTAKAYGACGGIAGGHYSKTAGSKTFTGCNVNAVNDIILESAKGVATALATASGGCGGIAGGDRQTSGTTTKTFICCSVNPVRNITINGLYANGSAEGGGGGIAGGEWSESNTCIKTFTGCSVNSGSITIINSATGGGLAGKTLTSSGSISLTGICSISYQSGTAPISGLTSPQAGVYFTLTTSTPAVITNYQKIDGDFYVTFSKAVQVTGLPINGLTNPVLSNSSSNIWKFTGNPTRDDRTFGSCLLCDGSNAFAVTYETGSSTLAAAVLSYFGSQVELLYSPPTGAPNIFTFQFYQNAFTYVLSGTFAASTTIQGDIGVNLRAVVSFTTDMTYAGSISGRGSLLKSSSGNVTLSGSNTYTGDTSVTGGTLTLGANFPISNLNLNGGTFNVGGFSTTMGIVAISANGGTITNGTITGSTYSVTNTASATISAALAGVGGLTKAGTGTLTLSGANTYTGDTIVTAGTLTLGANFPISNLNLNGGTFNVGGFSTTMGTVAISANGGTISNGTITSGTTYSITNTSSASISAILAGSIGLTKEGTGTLTLSGVNTYTGGTIISAGTLQGTNTSLPGPITNNTNIIFNQDTTGTYAGVISGIGALTKTGIGMLTLSGANTYTGDTIVTAGGLTLGSNFLISHLNVNGGTFDLGGNSTSMSTVTINDNGGTIQNGTLTGSTYNISTVAPARATITASLTGTGRLSKYNTGILTLSGENTYTGPTLIVGGTLRTLAGALNKTSSITINAAVLFAVDYNSVASLTLDSTGTATILGTDISVGPLTNTNTTANSLNFTGTTGTITAASLTGPGSTTFGNNATITNNGISQGIIRVAGLLTSTISGGAVTTGSLASTAIAGGILTNAGSAVIGTLSGGNSNFSGITSIGTLSGGTLEIMESSVTIGGGNFNGVISGTGALTSTGTLTLSGSNTYAGETIVTSGILTIGPNFNISNLNVNGGTFNLGGGTKTIGIVTISANGGTIQNGTITGSSYNVTNTASAAISAILAGGGGLTKEGTGTLTLSGDNSYTGDTIVRAGTLTLGVNYPITNLNLDGGTFNLGGFSTTMGIVTISANGGTIQNGTITGSSYRVTNTASASISAALAGSIGLTKEGTGTLTLSGDNSYTGDTIVRAGTLTLGANYPITNLNLDGGTFNLNGFSTTMGIVTISANGGTISNGTITGSSYRVTNTASASISAALAGGGGLTKEGTGTLTLSGDNSYTGGTTISAGTLMGTTSSLQGSITNNAHVTFNQETPGTYNGAISGSGAFTKEGTGTLTLSGDNSYTGDTIVRAGTLTLGVNYPITNLNLDGGTFNLGGFSTTMGIVAISANGGTISNGTITGSTYSVMNIASAAISAILAGGGGLTKEGTGTLTLSGANTYTGDTIVRAGTLTLGATFPMSNLNLDGGTFNLGGFSTTMGIVTISANGGTIQNGTITGSSYSITNTASASISAALAGGVGLTKEGTGTLTLSGANSYTGDTTISAGRVVITGINLNLKTLTNNSSVSNALDFTGTTGTIKIRRLLGTGATRFASKASISTLDISGPIALASGKTLSISSTLELLRALQAIST
jgi:fibronectin-binding autotransporter adhesin